MERGACAEDINEVTAPNPKAKPKPKPKPNPNINEVAAPPAAVAAAREVRLLRHVAWLAPHVT